MNARQNLGRRAEQAAVEHFERTGWRVLGRNVRIGRGEIDIIMRRGSTLVFAEVKARATTVCGSPEDAVDARKRRQVARLAELWLTVHPRALENIEDVRFDVVAVDASSVPLRIRHLPAAFTRDL